MNKDWRSSGVDSDCNSWKLSFESGKVIMDIDQGRVVLEMDREQSVNLIAGVAFQMRGFDSHES